MNYLQFKHKFLLHGSGEAKLKLNEGRYYLTSGKVGNYALFAGGYKSGGCSATVEAIDYSHTLISAPSLRQARYQMASAYCRDSSVMPFKEYILFGGGRKGSSVYSYVEAYDTSLTKSNVGALSNAVYNLAGATTNYCAIFAGGENADSYYTTVDVYLGYSLAKTPLSNYALTTAVSELASTSIFDTPTQKTYAVFGGGAQSDVAMSNIYAFDANLTSFGKNYLTTGLSVARHKLAATNIGYYALFGGGRGNGTVYPNVDAFDISLTRTNPKSLSKARMDLTATSTNSNAYFGGGEVNGTRSDVVDSYTQSLTQAVESPLSVARYALASEYIGGKAVFVGGYGASPTYSDVIDVYPK